MYSCNTWFWIPDRQLEQSDALAFLMHLKALRFPRKYFRRKRYNVKSTQMMVLAQKLYKLLYKLVMIFIHVSS